MVLCASGCEIGEKYANLTNAGVVIVVVVIW